MWSAAVWLLCNEQREHWDGRASAAGGRISTETQEEMVVRQGRVRRRRWHGRLFNTYNNPTRHESK